MIDPGRIRVTGKQITVLSSIYSIKNICYLFNIKEKPSIDSLQRKGLVVVTENSLGEQRAYLTEDGETLRLYLIDGNRWLSKPQQNLVNIFGHDQSLVNIHINFNKDPFLSEKVDAVDEPNKPLQADTSSVVVQSNGNEDPLLPAKGIAIDEWTLQAQLRTAEETGRLGEACFSQWLAKNGHIESEVHWVSKEHARSSYDFFVTSPRWEEEPKGLFIDVKATSGKPGGTFHMSMAEVRFASEHSNYRIARVSDVGSVEHVEILSGIHELSRTIIEVVMPSLPGGVTVDCFEIRVSLLRPSDKSL